MRAAEAIFERRQQSCRRDSARQPGRRSSLRYHHAGRADCGLTYLGRDSIWAQRRTRPKPLGRYLRPSRRAGQEYRERKRDLRLLLGDPASLRRTRAGEEISAALAIRRSELAGPAGQLRSLERGGLLRRLGRVSAAAFFICT